MGGDAFCFKACDPSKPNPARYCEHIFDRIGCAFNSPNNAKNGTFEACDAENADYPGVYTSNGQVMTYTQPAESLGPITTVPYTARVPASSNCRSITSSQAFTGLPTVTASSPTKSNPSTLVTSKSSGPTPSGTGNTTSSSSASDGTALAISGVSLLGVVFSALFLA